MLEKIRTYAPVFCILMLGLHAVNGAEYLVCWLDMGKKLTVSIIIEGGREQRV
jgi:hypothetical protein